MTKAVRDILVVCSGNICRSPYGAGYLRHRLGSAVVRIRSGGTLGIVGAPPSPETVALAREDGFDLDAHRSRGVAFDDVDESAVILVMEHRHRLVLEERFPEAAAKIHLLSEYHPAVARPALAPDIFDPIGASLEEYRRCFALVRDSIEGFLSGSGLGP